jgi:hypothetical protein
MLSKGFFESIYRESNRIREGCGDNGCGGAEEPHSDCGGSGCGFRESLHKMNECGSTDRGLYSGCGGSSRHYKQSGCGSSYSDEIDGYCKIGSIVEISYTNGCGNSFTEHGRLIGYY